MIPIQWRISRKQFYAGIITSLLLIATLFYFKYQCQQNNPASIEGFLLPNVPAVCDTKDKTPLQTIQPAPTRNISKQAITPAPSKTLPPIVPPKEKKAISCVGGLNLAPPPANVQQIIYKYSDGLDNSEVAALTEKIKTDPLLGPLVKEYNIDNINNLSSLLILQNNIAFSTPESLGITDTQKNNLGTQINAVINDINPIISQFANNYFSTREQNTIANVLAQNKSVPVIIEPEDIKIISDAPVQPAINIEKNKAYIMDQANKGNIYLDIEKCINFLTAGLSTGGTGSN